jgi:hypothetical protein
LNNLWRWAIEIITAAKRCTDCNDRGTGQQISFVHVYSINARSNRACISQNETDFFVTGCARN